MKQRRYNAPSAGLRFQASLGVLLKESFLGVFLLSDFSLKCLSDVIGLFKIWAAFLKGGPLLWYAGRLSSGETSAFWKYTCTLEIHPRSGKHFRSCRCGRPIWAELFWSCCIYHG